MQGLCQGASGCRGGAHTSGAAGKAPGQPPPEAVPITLPSGTLALRQVDFAVTSFWSGYIQKEQFQRFIMFSHLILAWTPSGWRSGNRLGLLWARWVHASPGPHARFPRSWVLWSEDPARLSLPNSLELYTWIRGGELSLSRPRQREDPRGRRPLSPRCTLPRRWLCWTRAGSGLATVASGPLNVPLGAAGKRT